MPHLGARVFSLMAAGDVEGAKKAQKELTGCFDVIFKQSKTGKEERKEGKVGERESVV